MADAQAAEAKRLAYAKAAVEACELALERERQKAREEAERNAAEVEAERIAAECPEEPPAAVNDAEAVPAASDDPMAVWVDINDGWEALDIHDIDAVELWANWVMQEGERQAKELAEALADRVA